MTWLHVLGIFVFASLAYIGFGTWKRRRLLREIVFSSLDSAAQNGYFIPGEHLYGASPDEIAYNMQCYGDCEDYTVPELTPYVRKWLYSKGRI
jgi:hypothetical protein